MNNKGLILKKGDTILYIFLIMVISLLCNISSHPIIQKLSQVSIEYTWKIYIASKILTFLKLTWRIILQGKLPGGKLVRNLQCILLCF